LIRADARNPLLADLLSQERVDVVCHLQFTLSYRAHAGISHANLEGAKNLLDACAQASVTKVVMMSSTMVYGAHPDNAAFIGEESALRAQSQQGYLLDLLEVEALAKAYQRAMPGTEVAMLRFGHIIGPSADTPMTRFLSSRWAPTLLGFDPMMQIIHEEDVIEALAHATLNAAGGAFNVATLEAMPLSQLVALSGKSPLAVLHPLLYRAQDMLGKGLQSPERYVPLDPDYLRYPCIGDLSRMREQLGFVPLYSAKEALLEFSALGPSPSRVAHAEALSIDKKRLARTLSQRSASGAQSSSKRNGEAFDG
jgi:UDP-glucose 4-epimerase